MLPDLLTGIGWCGLEAKSHSVENAPANLDAPQLRAFVELLLKLSLYGLFEEAAEQFAGSDENHDRTEDEILIDALAKCADDKLMGFTLRLLLTGHVVIQRGEQSIGFSRPSPSSLQQARLQPRSRPMVNQHWSKASAKKTACKRAAT